MSEMQSPIDAIQDQQRLGTVMPGAVAPEAERPESFDDVLNEIKQRLEMSLKRDNDNRAAALDDLQFLTGESQWDIIQRRMREAENRPCMTINKLATFAHLVENDLRRNVPSIHISPVDSNADIETAKVIQGLVRHIEYASNADICYDTASTSAVRMGWGYFRLVTRYCSPDSFDSDIRFERIRNPFTVYMDDDPAGDGSSAQWCIISGRLPRDEFKRQYPNAQITSASFDLGVGDGDKLAWAEEWIGNGMIRVAEYYRIVQVEDELLELSDGSKGFRSELESLNGAEISRSRPTMRKIIEWYKATPYEVIDHTEIKCEWIPVIPVYGEELDIDGRIVRSGIVRNAKDPARTYNYWITAATEEIALRTKTPFIGAEGQFEGREEEWNQANVRSWPYLEYKQVALDGTLAPPPQRQPAADVPIGFLQMAMVASDNIKATTGLFDASIGALGTATSGIQERAQQTQGQVTNLHFADNLMRAVRQAGRCIISMIPYYYDSARIVRIMGEDGKISHAEINQPNPAAAQPQPQKEGKQAKAIKTVLNDMTVGEYDVVVKTGPTYQTLRQEAAEAQISLAKAWPQLMEVAGDIVTRNFDWPGAEEIAERIKRTIPPAITQDDDDEQADAPVVKTPRGDIPVEQAAQMLQEMDQQMRAMAAELQEAKAGITKAKVDAQSRVDVAEINAVSAADVAELKAMVELLIAKMPPPPVLAAEVAGDLARDEANPAAPLQSSP